MRDSEAQTNIIHIPDNTNDPDDILIMQLPDGKIGTNVLQAIVWHSPTGFNVGYGGSGPADFALNILARFVPKSAAIDMHQDFKREFIQGMEQPKDGQVERIKSETITEWIKRHPLWKGGEQSAQFEQ